MATDQTTRDRLEKLELEARTHPRRHAARLWAITLLGYLYPATILMTCLAIIVVLLLTAPAVWKSEVGIVILVHGGLVIAFAALAITVLRAFVVALPEPTGFEVRRADAPALWAMIGDLQQSVGVRRVHRLFLTEQLNAAAVQRPRWAIGGPSNNYIIVGIPLMMAVTPAQLKCIIAHELLHLSKRHSTFGSRIYRVHHTWQSLAVPFARKGWLRWLTLGWFVRWYGRQVAVTTLALRRQYEYEADCRAADVVNARTAGWSLIRVGWTSYRFDRTFIADLARATPDQPLPPHDFLGLAREFLAQPGLPGQSLRWRNRETRCRTPITSDHPCLRDRLTSLGMVQLLDDLNQATTPTNGDDALQLLGPSLDRACKTINATWKATVIHQWRARHHMAKEARDQAAKKRPSPPEPAADDADRAAILDWKNLQSDIDRASTQEAEEIVRQFIGRHQEHGPAHYVLGRLLLRQDDESAVPYLERALTLDSEMIGPSLHLLLDYYRDLGRDDEAEPIRARLEVFERELGQARLERLVVHRSDQFEPHALPAEDLEKLRRLLYRFPQIERAWLARKRVRLFSDKPSYLIAVDRRAPLFDDRRWADKRLTNAVAAQLRLPGAVVVWQRMSRRLRRRLLAACPEPIFIAAPYRPRATD